MAIPTRKFDAVIVGAGGAGMRASLQLAEAGFKVAVLSKVFPTRSHTVAAQGGIGAALGNMGEDSWLWHMYDTIKGSDYLGDQDAIEFMCRMAPEAVYELEHFGMPFDRNQDGTVYQRPFGGHSQDFGERPVQRSCCAADRTGHAMLHTLYQRNVRANTQFFVEWMALDLIRDASGQVLGVTALEMETGEVYILHARAVLFATGGAGRIFAASTNAFINTGRRSGHGRARRHSAGGHGVLAVPPDRRGRRRRADHRGRARRRRLPAEQERRALHGALRADHEGPRQPRRGLARHGDRDQGRARLRAGSRPCSAQARPPGRGADREQAAGHPRDRQEVRQRGSGDGPDPGSADRPLSDGRHSDQLSRRGRGAGGRQSRRRSSRVSMLPANAPAHPCMAPIAWAPTRCTDLLVFGKASGDSMIRFLRENPGTRTCPSDAADRTLARLARLQNQRAARTSTRWPTTCAAPCRRIAACSASRICWRRG